MKIWELCNKVKGTNETKETIENWAYFNRVCPLMFDVALEIEELDEDGYPKDNNPFIKTARRVCDDNKCNVNCLRNFLNSEVEE